MPVFEAALDGDSLGGLAEIEDLNTAEETRWQNLQQTQSRDLCDLFFAVACDE